MANNSIPSVVSIGALGLSAVSLIRSGQALDSVNNLTTDDIAEGTTNKYYSDISARNSLSQGSYINYNSMSGVIAVDHTPASQTIYVDKSGNDSTGDGSILKPYLTIQEAHTHALTYPASAYVHIKIGPGAFNEDLIITRLKTSIIGSVDAVNKTTAISSLTVNITTTVDGVFNDIVSISNILVEKSSGSSIVTLGGNQQFTFNANNTYFYTAGASTSCLNVTNTSAGGIRMFLFKCIAQNENSNTSSMNLTNVSNGRLENCAFGIYAGSNSCLNITNSNIVALNTTFQTNSGTNVINIVSSFGTPFNPITQPTGSIAFTCGNCTFANSSVNGSGIFMAANATSFVAQSLFFITPGTGSSVGGSAPCYFINGNNLVSPGTNSTVAGTVTRINMAAL